MICLFASVVGVQAGTPLRFHRLSVLDGLSQNNVYTVIQNKQGFIWVGTRDGLNRYDGYEFITYRHDPEDPNSLSDSFILDIHEDPEGILWIGTTGGLNRFDPAALEGFTRYPDLFPGEYVDLVTQGRDGDLWIGTSQGRVARLEVDGKQLTSRDVIPTRQIRGSSRGQIWEIVPEGDTVWVGTDEALYQMNARMPDEYRAFKHDPADPDSLGGNDVRSILRTRDGALWVACRDGGLSRLAPGESERFTRFLPDPDDPNSLDTIQVISLFEDNRGVLWIGTFDAGLYSMDPAEPGVFHNYRHQPMNAESLSYDSVWTLFQDRSGMMWAGTFGGGLNRFDPLGVPFVNYRHDHATAGLSHGTVTSVETVGRDEIWVGTAGGGLNSIRFGEPDRYKAWRKDPRQPDSLRDNDILSLAVQDNILWVGTRRGGLNRMSLDRPGVFDQFIHDPDDPESLSDKKAANIFVDRDGSLWVGTDQGLNLMRPDRPGKFRRFVSSDDPHGLSHDWVMCALRDRQGRLWVITYGGGLQRLDDVETGRFTGFRYDANDPDSINSDAVRSIQESRDGSLWLGTALGLNRFGPDRDRFEHWEEKDGLPNGVVHAVLEDERGFIWLTTNRGLSRFDPEKEIFLNFDANDGLQSNEFRTRSSARGPDGRMYFGGVNGLTAFYPEKIRGETRAPNVILTGFFIFNEPVPPGFRMVEGIEQKSPLPRPVEAATGVTLNYTDRAFSFAFSGLKFNDPEKTRYRYRMEPFDPEWNLAQPQQRLATYTNMDPGAYTFRVQAAGRDGVWSEPGKSIQVRIEAPAWQTWWARLLYIAATAALLFWYARVQHLKYEREKMKVEHLRQVERLKDEFNRQLEKKVRERTDELIGTRRKLVESARMAGMAEIASDVLHSVGNTLNSVRTSIHIIQEQNDVTRWLGLLERISERMGEYDSVAEWLDQDPKATDLPLILDRIALKLRSQKEGIAEEIGKLFEQVQSIVAVLLKQHQYTLGRGWTPEATDLNLAVSDALESESYIYKDKPIEIFEDFKPLPPVTVEKGKLNRIIFFLLKNSVEALEGLLEDRKGFIRIGTRVSKAEVILEFSDNGAGIARGNLKHVFNHGFSTKGREGFGLHYCANAMKEMAGRIEVFSEGLGKGASVQLFFPLPLGKQEEEKDRVKLLPVIPD
ncbi:MAG: two-component regulator propeller domain-containing protein [Acidobacteriota bacterium]|nr:two-component regulator propeller domain-containing protein [Acidobacteriota bacterium]